MRRAMIVLWVTLACAVFPTPGGALAVTGETAFAAILYVCEAVTLEEAEARGERLGWPAAPDDRNWRAAFERHNGGTVRLIGWRRGGREGDGLLSYWVASGRNAHEACTFATDLPGLLEALRDRFGAPDTFDEHGEIVSAFWQRDGAEIYFTRVGKSTHVNLSRRG